MPSPLRSPKTLAEWMELDYFRRRRLFRRPWRLVTWSALLVSCLGVGWTFLPGKQTVYQAGPLASAHTMFNQDCGRCHTESFPVWSRLATFDSSVRSVPDQACIQCHSGPLHHFDVEQRSCASCHREHRGHAALSRVTDDQCTACHADLLRVKSDSKFEKHITRFAEGHHPEFRLFRSDKPSDPGLRFNHAVHLEGLLDIDRKQQQAHEKALQKAGFTRCTEELPTIAIRLECQSCHEVDEAGRYMKPINFEQHCQKCHPLSVQLMGSWQGEQRQRACEFSERPAPHPSVGKKAEVVRAALRERLTRFILNEANKSFLRDREPEELPRPLPGWIRGEAVPAREFAWVNQQLEQMERVLFDGGGGCRHCHEEQTIPSKRPGGLPEYKPLALHNLQVGGKPWYEDSVFRHDSHKMLTCLECHKEARQSESARDVMLPRIDNCFRCHQQGEHRARADCVECHTYHDRNLKRQFRGTLTIDQTLGR